MKRILSAMGLVAVILSAAFACLAEDDSLDRQKKALQIISDFADHLCSDVPLNGNSQQVQLNGDAKAKLKGIVSKVADLGFEGAAKTIVQSTKDFCRPI